MSLFASALCVALCIGLLGCASPKEHGALPLADAPPFSAAGQVESADRWWLAFDDPGLEHRIERALEANYDLAAAWERFHAANALARRSRSDSSPELDALAGVQRRESSGNSDQTQFTIGLEASYEMDLWGNIQSQADAEAMRAQASAQDYRVLAISLSSSITLVWYQLAEAQMQLALVGEQLEVNQTTLDLLDGRFVAGQVRSADILRQRQLVEATREQRIVLESRLAVLEHQLALLQGRAPQGGIELPSPRLPELLPTPATGLPASLVQRRPDIRAAMLRLDAADHDLSAAVTDQYPQLNLSASLQTLAERPHALFDDWLLSLAGEFVAPVFDGDRRAAQVQRNEAIRRQRVAEYGQSVLNAFGEVEDALVQEAKQAQRIASLDSQLQLAEQTVDQLRTQYLNGVTDYIAVLSAVRDQQQLQRDLLSARLGLIALRIELYRALAGGFETPREREQESVQDALADQPAQLEQDVE